MRKNIILIVCLCLASGFIMAETKEEKEIRLIKKNISFVENSKEWIVKNIIEFSYSDSDPQNNIDKVLMNKFHSSMKGTSYFIDEDRAFVDIIIFSRGIYYFIYCYEREEYNGDIYEYWFINKDGTDWSGVTRSAEFIITKSNSLHGKREIIKRSDQFFEKYTIDNVDIVTFEKSNMWKVHKLEPWLYPLNYKNSDLDEYYVWAKDRVESVKGVFSIDDIVWGRKKLGYWKLRKYKKLQAEGGYGINFGGYTFPSED